MHTHCIIKLELQTISSMSFPHYLQLETQGSRVTLIKQILNGLVRVERLGHMAVARQEGGAVTVVQLQGAVHVDGRAPLLLHQPSGHLLVLGWSEDQVIDICSQDGNMCAEVNKYCIKLEA